MEANKWILKSFKVILGKDLILITEPDRNQDRETIRREALNTDKWFITL